MLLPWVDILQAALFTVYMVTLSTLLAIFIGVPLGVYLFVIRPGSLHPRLCVYRLVNAIVNITRSIPFIILMMILIPVTRLLIGTAIGTNAAIVPLTISAIPFIARLVESSLLTVPKGLTEMGLSLGAPTFFILRQILLPEAASDIIRGLTLTAIAILGYAAMAGAVGGGGLGDVAIRYGYQRFDIAVMVITVAILVLMVQALQAVGSWLSNKIAP